jgi:DNA-binding NtrC family response regulator
MPDNNVRVLVIEDDPGLLDAYVKRLTSDDYIIDAAQEMTDARSLVGQHDYAVILTDLKLHTSDEGGLEILSEVKKSHPDTQVIIFSGVGDTQAVVRAFRLSADGYVTKPLDFNRVREQIMTSIGVYRWQRSLRDEDAANPVRREPVGMPQIETPEPYYAYAESMQKIVKRAKRLYRTSENILITGEAGTGKSLLAEGIHRGSKRPGFELINCAGLSDVTLEPVLFGMVEDDSAIKPGVLQRLEGGTLVLDRVSSIGKRLQIRLLEALQSGHFSPAPDVEPIKVNVRIISIDEGYLVDDVNQGLFVEELYKLLSRAYLHVPPLRERYDDSYRDAPILAQQFITQKYEVDCQLDPEAEYMIERYPFPGNVAELDRAIRQALGILNGSKRILPEHLPPSMLRYGVRPGLGVIEDDKRVLCPHGPFYCDRTGMIANAHRSMNGVYLRLGNDFPSDTLVQITTMLRQLGMTPLQVERIPDAQTPMCATCIPTQSSHFAIVNVTDDIQHVLYDLGLLHALGTPTLILSKSNDVFATHAENLNPHFYEDGNSLIQIVEHWLNTQVQ